MVVILWKESTEALITRFRDAGFRSAERRCRPLLYRLNRRIYYLYHVRATRRKRVICNCSSCLATISSVTMPTSRYQWGRNWRQILSHARLKRPFFTKHFLIFYKCIVLLVNSITFFTLLHQFAQYFLCDHYVPFYCTISHRFLMSLTMWCLRFVYVYAAIEKKFTFIKVPLSCGRCLGDTNDDDGDNDDALWQAVWYIALTWTSC